ncbi:MAG: MFS transporter [Deltaproteobacteria bacterium]|nr:MFS transporter [Deltaproteobacteria bacterium]
MVVRCYRGGVHTEGTHPGTTRAATLAVMVAALGYFVDVYDLILFGMVRTASLRDLGVADTTGQGIYLLNMQMGGMLLGGILFGVLGDRRGRISVLFGSITLYSLANIANGFVDTVDQYAWCRAIAGIGLAGELGAGITLVSELMRRETRGFGTTIVAAFGVSGGAVAGLVGGAFPGIGVDWRTAYFIGGGMGLALLVLRIGVVESGMFAAAAAKPNLARGNFLSLFTDRKRFARYLAIICVGVPVWFVGGVLCVLSPELGLAMGLPEAPRAATSLFFFYLAATFGDVASGLVSQRLRSRKRTLAIFLTGSTIVISGYFLLGGTSLTVFYALCLAGGLTSGYWAVFVSTAAELFGTNLRATVATTVPNFVRGTLVLLMMMLTSLREPLGIVGAAVAVGAVSMAVAFIGLISLPETFAIDLDYHEGDDQPDRLA